MANLSIVLEFGGKNVRMVGTAEVPEWVARDVCEVLELSQRDAMARIPAVEKGYGFKPEGAAPHEALATIREPGLYRLIFHSRKEQARRFQDFVFGEVLPCIRRHGCYPAPAVQQPKLDERVVILLEQLVMRHDQMLARQNEQDQRLTALERRNGALISVHDYKEMRSLVAQVADCLVRLGRAGKSPHLMVDRKLTKIFEWGSAGHPWKQLPFDKAPAVLRFLREWLKEVKPLADTAERAATRQANERQGKFNFN